MYEVIIYFVCLAGTNLALQKLFDGRSHAFAFPFWPLKMITVRVHVHVLCVRNKLCKRLFKSKRMGGDQL